jgi:CO/xanthine dehydrogenase FAD-binding subunit
VGLCWQRAVRAPVTPDHGLVPTGTQMSHFEYQRPGNLAETSDLLLRDDAVALAGGTDLLVALRHGRTRPRLVVDLKHVEEIGDEIVLAGDRLVVGARVAMSHLVGHVAVGASFPALVSAASVVGSVQIRNRATLAGNLCNASPAADTAPPLLAYSAAVNIDGPGGARLVALGDFFVGPGQTVLRRGEVVTAVELPITEARMGSAFARVTRRRGVDLASVSIACVVDEDRGARFGFGAVGPTPLVAESSVDAVESDEGLEQLLSVTSLIDDVRASADYRQSMLRVHTRRALRAAVEDLKVAS